MSELYIVTNPPGLNVRSKPDTNTGAVRRRMANGEAFYVNLIFHQAEFTWGRVSLGDSVEQAFVCLQMGNKMFARQMSGGQPPAAGGWAAAIDAWARSKGYMGPLP